MDKFTPAAFVGSSDLVVMGCNPENADYTNPRGEYYGFAPYVAISNEYGDRFVMRVGPAVHYESEANHLADTVCAALRARWEKLGKLPVGFDRWVKGRPVYGSQAYIDYGADDDIELERREAEEEAWA